MKDDRSSKILLLGQQLRAKKACLTQMGLKEAVRKDFREIGTLWEGLKGRLRKDWDIGGACVAVLTSGGLVLHSCE